MKNIKELEAMKLKSSYGFGYLAGVKDFKKDMLELIDEMREYTVKISKYQKDNISCINKKKLKARIEKK